MSIAEGTVNISGSMLNTTGHVSLSGLGSPTLSINGNNSFNDFWHDRRHVDEFAGNSRDHNRPSRCGLSRQLP